MNITRIYERLPPDSGVTFEGFEVESEYLKLKSREIVREKLEKFISACKDAQKPIIRVILGEWGEGKTDAYKRYIKPTCEKNGDYAFFVSASTLSNGYGKPYVSRLIENVSLSAVRFLVVLFDCVKEENKEEKIPNPLNYKNAFDYLDDVLNKLIGAEKTRRIFIFIDEFEELLLTPDKLREIISGIKEAVNGSYREISEGGKYAGCVHFIIAATPDAYYRLESDERTSLIFGGFERRVPVIDLPQIRKEEGINFLFELLNYAYKNNLPEQLPVINFGIFNAIFHITQGNPGNIVSFFSRLMGSAKNDDNTVKIIDGEHFLKFLENEKVFVYGSSANCLEKETFTRFLKIIEETSSGQKCSQLFKIMVGEFKPFSIEELADRIKYKEIPNLVNIINDVLSRREGIGKAILKVRPLSEEKNFSDVENVFKDFIKEEKDRKYIMIDNYLERIETFEDRITYFEYNKNKMVRKIYLPIDEGSIKSFFEGIDTDRVVEINNKIKRLCKNEDYYIVSHELLSQVFPTPVPPELGFIKNRDERLKMWREITRKFAEEYDKNIAPAFIGILKKSGYLSIEEEPDYSPNNNIRFVTISLEGDVKIKSAFFFINGNVGGIDIESIRKRIRERSIPTHCVFLIFTGELTEEAKSEIEDKGMGKKGENIILEIRIHPTLAKRIICWYEAEYQMSDTNVDKNLLSSVANKIVQQELGIPIKLENWLKEQQEKGIAIIDLSPEGTSDLKEFAAALKFFINFMEDEATLDEIYKRNQELLEFTLYAKKGIGLIPDIQYDKFKQIINDLLKYNFLAQNKDKYKVQFHPVENQILKLLKKRMKLSLNELEKFFIIKPGRCIIDVFLPILESKGLIKEENNYYTLTEKDKLYSEVNDIYNTFKKLVNNEKYKKYAYIYITKKRGSRFISLKDFEIFINNLYKKLDDLTGLEEEIVYQKLYKFYLMKKLLLHFNNELFPRFKRASEEIEKILESAHYMRDEMKALIEGIEKEYNKWLRFKFTPEKVKEYKKIQELLEEIEKVASYNDEEVKVLVENFKEEEKDHFYFSNEENNYFFNPKYYKIYSLYNEINILKNNCENTIRILRGKFNNFNGLEEEIQSKLKEKNIDEKYKISYIILNKLKDISKGPSYIEISELSSITMEDLSQIVEENGKSINKYLANSLSCISSIDTILGIEKDFIDYLERASLIINNCKQLFDIEDYSNIIEGIYENLEQCLNKYESYLKEIKLNDPESIKEEINQLEGKIKNLKETLRKQIEQLESKWEEYAETIKDFISNTNDILKLFSKSPFNSDIIEKQLSTLSSYANIKEIEKLDLKLSNLENYKKEVRKTLYDSLKEQISSDELLLLEKLLGKFREDPWLPLEKIYQLAKNELNFGREKTEELLKKLINKGFLKEGLSMAI